jgi:hypothetical protein
VEQPVGVGSWLPVPTEEGKRLQKVLEYDDQTKPVVPNQLQLTSTLIQNHDESA